jgi:N-acetyl-gamma-glutamyl-phosphate reductase
MKTALRVAIVGASGYTGEELIKYCSKHQGIELAAISSRQYAGKKVSEVIGFLKKDYLFEDLKPDEVASRVDVIFLALPHGVSAEYAKPLLHAKKTIIDLSADFRLKDSKKYHEFYDHEHPLPEALSKSVYGLPELYHKQLKEADLIACPGCYPTSILLALSPLVKNQLIDLNHIVINSLSGVSGAGKKVQMDYLFCENNENMRPYGSPKHRHLSEIEQELSLLAGKMVTVSFTPHLVPLTRGMLTTIHAPFKGRNAEEVYETFSTFYKNSPFVHFLGDQKFPEVKHVAHTNDAEIAFRLDERTNKLIIFSVIDNLGKGAAGQAMQCFNLRFGFDEREGL